MASKKSLKAKAAPETNRQAAYERIVRESVVGMAQANAQCTSRKWSLIYQAIEAHPMAAAYGPDIIEMAADNLVHDSRLFNPELVDAVITNALTEAVLWFAEHAEQLFADVEDDEEVFA